MTTLEYTKTDDLKTVADFTGKVDLSPFVGTWTNTKLGSGQLPKVIMTESAGELFMQGFGARETELQDWGKVPCTVFTDAVDSDLANAFMARYEFESMDVEISSNVKLGVLVVQTYTRFKDGSDRYNYYAREFYARKA